MLKNLKTINTEPFRPHDLRRTASTTMTANGISREIVSKIVNHSESGVTRIYDRYSYDKEKKNAMNKWDRILKKIISSDTGKVVEISR